MPALRATNACWRGGGEGACGARGREGCASECECVRLRESGAGGAAQVQHAAPAIVEDTLAQMVHGAAAQLHRAGCALVGGHSGEGAELALGLCVHGHAPREALMFKHRLRAGEALVLTKALGSGVVLRGAMLRRARGSHQRAVWSSMLQSNQAASRILREFGVRACTDVSGFGLLGHACEMATASQVRGARAVPAVEWSVPCCRRD